jgi:hypothetical protein
MMPFPLSTTTDTSTLLKSNDDIPDTQVQVTSSTSYGHVKQVEVEKYFCNSCRSSFKTLSSLTIHRKVNHLQIFVDKTEYYREIINSHIHIKLQDTGFLFMKATVFVVYFQISIQYLEVICVYNRDTI